ncbi:MAG TPA: helix-turn-helix domain-containing protein [Candidatus Methanofastidiosa archaeon]|nr:helix-turn-helix domain-containing protein [Candidatus Methanofastidiosa archaeon]
MQTRESLQEVGLTEYEARVVISAVSAGGSTAKSLSGSSGVPYSRIYGTLDSLVGKGWLIRTDGRPSMFLPGDVDALLEKHLKERRQRIDELKHHLSSMRRDGDAVMNPSFSIGYGWEAFLEKLSMLHGAAGSVNGVIGFSHKENLPNLMDILNERFVQGLVFVKEKVFLENRETMGRIADKNVRTLSFTPPLWLFFIDGKDILLAIPLDPKDEDGTSDVKYLELNNFTMGDMLSEIMGVALRDSRQAEGL